MKGLEISIINLSEVRNSDPTNRLDSEFFKKEYKTLFQKLSNHTVSKASQLCSKITQGPNPNFIEDHTGIPCLTGRNINKGRVTYIDSDFISKDEYDNLNRFQILKGDTLITLKGKGSIGKIGFVTEDRPAIFSRNIGLIRPNKINSGYVNAFLLSKFGKKMIERGETGGTGQSTLTSSYLMNIDIPRLDIEDTIGEIILRSEEVSKQSETRFSDAQNLLNRALFLEDFRPSTKSVNIKSFKDSFVKTGRFDSEYYQPKYEEYLMKIEQYPLGFQLLSKSVKLKDKNFNPSDDVKYKYIELSNIGRTGDINGYTWDTGKELPTRARRLINTNDVIISSIEGALDSCALVTAEYNNAICSTGFYVVNSDIINSETLLVLFKSDLIQNFLKKSCSGTILTAITKDEFLKIPIPNVDELVQQEIAVLVQESFKLKSESDTLLSSAKRAVEIAIEQSEEKAIEYMTTHC